MIMKKKNIGLSRKLFLLQGYLGNCNVCLATAGKIW